jgi:hypothetical protein
VSDRIPCCIPDCRRTFKRTPGESDDVITMCGRHWRMGDQPLRDRHKQLRKRARWFERKVKYGHKISKRPKFEDAHNRAAWAAHRAWHRVKDDVIIKAALGAEDAPRRRPTVEKMA